MTAALWIAVGWACLLVAWLAMGYRRWRQMAGARALWQAREDMEAALWAECTAEAAASAVDRGCKVPPAGWFCTRHPGHEGPCAAIPSVHVDSYKLPAECPRGHLEAGK